jgi:nucleotide-binding universal stress UspA family protein
MFEKILVCLDGSEYAEQILPYAENEALVHHSQLILLRIVSEPNMTVVESGASYREIQELAEQEQSDVQDARSYLKNTRATLRDKGISAEAVVLEASHIGKAIVNYAEKNGIGLIAIATHSRGNLVQMFIGSVAEYILRNSGLPLLMIRPKVE